MTRFGKGKLMIHFDLKTVKLNLSSTISLTKRQMQLRNQEEDKERKKEKNKERNRGRKTGARKERKTRQVRSRKSRVQLNEENGTRISRDTVTLSLAHTHTHVRTGRLLHF